MSASDASAAIGQFPLTENSVSEDDGWQQKARGEMMNNFKVIGAAKLTLKAWIHFLLSFRFSKSKKKHTLKVKLFELSKHSWLHPINGQSYTPSKTIIFPFLNITYIFHVPFYCFYLDSVYLPFFIFLFCILVEARYKHCFKRIWSIRLHIIYPSLLSWGYITFNPKLDGLLGHRKVNTRDTH